MTNYPDTGPHTANIIQAGAEGWLQASPKDGYLVQCPYGCDLGTSRHRPDRKAAERRVELHRLATTPAGRQQQPVCKCCIDNGCECKGASIETGTS